MPKYYGCPCEGCGRPLALTDDIVVCPDCGAPYHRECYEKLGRCIHTPAHWRGRMNGRSRTKTMLCAPAPRCGERTLAHRRALPLLRCWPRGWACPVSPLPVPSAGASCWRLRCRIIFWTCRERKLYKASPSGLRPQARVEAQPPEAALSAETEAVTEGA